MTRSIQDIDAHFDEVRFNGDCADFRKFVQEILTIPEAERRASLELYYDILTHVVKALFLENCGGTLSEREKSEIFSLIRSDWSDEGPSGFQASVLMLLGMIQPLEGVREWLLPIADRHGKSIYAEALRGCADCSRTKPAV